METNGDGKRGKYLARMRRGTEKENEVMAEKYTNAQTDFPLVDSTLSTEGAGPFCGWGRVKSSEQTLPLTL